MCLEVFSFFIDCDPSYCDLSCSAKKGSVVTEQVDPPGMKYQDISAGLATENVEEDVLMVTKRM